MKKQKRSRYDAIADGFAQEFAHQNSYTIHSRMRILCFESEEADKAIVALTGALANMRERRAKVEAMLRGLASVVEKR